MLADLGVSSMQIDNPERGFSFKQDGPLDLRMNPHRGRPASALVAALNKAELARLLAENADEPHATPIARSILKFQSRNPIATTRTLAEAVGEAMFPGKRSKEEVEHSIRRTFQALRIAVNDEFSALETFLRHLPECLKPGGRAVILTFHSGEDRRVKKAFQAGERSGLYARIAPEIIRPSPIEVRSIPACPPPNFAGLSALNGSLATERSIRVKSYRTLKRRAVWNLTVRNQFHKSLCIVKICMVTTPCDQLSIRTEGQAEVSSLGVGARAFGTGLVQNGGGGEPTGRLTPNVPGVPRRVLQSATSEPSLKVMERTGVPRSSSAKSYV